MNRLNSCKKENFGSKFAALGSILFRLLVNPALRNVSTPSTGIRIPKIRIKDLLI